MYERETTGVGRGPFPRTGSAPERYPSIHRSPGAGVDDAYGRVPIQDAVEVQARLPQVGMPGGATVGVVSRPRRKAQEARAPDGRRSAGERRDGGPPNPTAPRPPLAALPARARERGLPLAGRDLYPLGLRPRLPWDLDVQDPVLEGGLDVVRANVTREGDLAPVVAEGDLAAHVVAFLALPLHGALGVDGQDAIGERDLHVLGLEAGDGGLDRVALLGLANVDREVVRRMLGQSAGGSSVGLLRCAERPAEHVAEETVHGAVQAREVLRRAPANNGQGSFTSFWVPDGCAPSSSLQGRNAHFDSTSHDSEHSVEIAV